MFPVYFGIFVVVVVVKAPNDWAPNQNVKKWLQKLNAMRAVDQIDEDDSRQLYMDLDSAYSEFTRHLKRNK
jgi:ESCRT-I complex subunit VPS28